MTKPRNPHSRKSDDLPATRGMLKGVRDELKSDIRALELKMDSGFAQMDSKIEKMGASFHAMQLMFEEQRADNRIVLEALTALANRQDRVELRMDGIERTVKQLAKSSRSASA